MGTILAGHGWSGQIRTLKGVQWNIFLFRGAQGVRRVKVGQVAVDTGTSMLAGPSRVIHELTRTGGMFFRNDPEMAGHLPLLMKDTKNIRTGAVHYDNLMESGEKGLEVHLEGVTSLIFPIGKFHISLSSPQATSGRTGLLQLPGASRPWFRGGGPCALVLRTKWSPKQLQLVFFCVLFP